MVTGADPAWAVRIPRSSEFELICPPNFIYAIQHAPTAEEAIRQTLRNVLYEPRWVNSAYHDLIGPPGRERYFTHQMWGNYCDPETGEPLPSHSDLDLLTEEEILAEFIQQSNCCMDEASSVSRARKGLWLYQEIDEDEFHRLEALDGTVEFDYVKRGLERTKFYNQKEEEARFFAHLNGGFRNGT